MHACGLNNDWSAAVVEYLIDLPAIKCNDVTVKSLDVRTGHKLCIRRQSFTRPFQYELLFLFRQVVDVTRVHVYGVREAGGMRPQ